MIGCAGGSVPSGISCDILDSVMGLLYETRSIRGEDVIEITGYDGQAESIEIPAEMDGLPVRSIGPHAFENRTDLRQVIVPEGCRTLRQFCFYGCTHLEYLSFPDTCDDYYDGVIRQCRALQEIRVRCHGDNYVLVRELLRDVESGLRFRLVYADHEVRLTFPEYVSEAKEDTYARAIHISFEGAGVAYRECVTKHAIDLAGYDCLLPRLTDYDLRAGMNIALDRLMTPEQLVDDARAQYERFLTERSAEIIPFLIDEKDVERVRFLIDNDILAKDAVRACLKIASKNVEISAMLMDYVQEQKAVTAFSLDDW